MTFSFGNHFRVTLFGESHGECVGVVIDGCPPGLEIDRSVIQQALDRRKPGQSTITTERKERDRVEIRSGLFHGKTTGAPLTLMIRNEDIDSRSYKGIKTSPRPGHADLTAWYKYNGFHDFRGGGIFSGRMTAALVLGGSLAKLILRKKEINVLSHLIQVGNVKIDKKISDEEIKRNVYRNSLRCADPETAKKMKEKILRMKKEGDSIGGIIECRIPNIPPGIGDPFFNSIESMISHIVFSVPGVKGIEFGSGFKCAEMKGTEHNDQFFLKDGKIITETNNAGGILGGISNGMPIVFRVAMKPTSSIKKTQKTVDIEKMEECEIHMKGRHDPCIAVRAVPVIEAVTSLVLLELYLSGSIDLQF